MGTPLGSRHVARRTLRNVKRALAQVEHYVEGRQRGSWTGRLRIALALDERPATVRQLVHLVQRISGKQFRLSAESDFADVFATMDESMLLLGQPGPDDFNAGFEYSDDAQRLLADLRERLATFGLELHPDKTG